MIDIFCLFYIMSHADTLMLRGKATAVYSELAEVKSESREDYLHALPGLPENLLQSPVPLKSTKGHSEKNRAAAVADRLQQVVAIPGAISKRQARPPRVLPASPAKEKQIANPLEEAR